MVLFRMSLRGRLFLSTTVLLQSLQLASAICHLKLHKPLVTKKSGRSHRYFHCRREGQRAMMKQQHTIFTIPKQPRTAGQPLGNSGYAT